MGLLSGYGKQGVSLNLLTKPADIIDTDYLSKYFVLQEFSPELTAGKNSITFNGSELLKKGSEVKVECVDSSGFSLYIESSQQLNVAYKESSAYVLSIHVYDETSNGSGKLILYGTASNGSTVKWVGNVLIDKTKSNVSSVRFYKKPVLEVVPVLSPVLAAVGELTKLVELTSSFYSFAVNPPKDSVQINKKNVDVDYRIYSKKFPFLDSPTGSFNSQMKDSEITCFIKTIQEPYTNKNRKVNITSSVFIKSVLNNTSLVLKDVLSFPVYKNNNVVINVVDGDFYIKYPYISYNTASESQSYMVANTKDGQTFVKQSYADIVYKNIKTFSGFIARHKLYRKSLFSPGDFEVIADEPLVPYELLQDKLTTNKSFDKMGVFYNQQHIEKYWFTGSNILSLSQSSNRIIDALYINIPQPYSNCNSLQNYIMVKDNSSFINRNGNYYSYNQNEFLFSSGSSYDSNFIELKKDVNYILSLNAIIKKDSSTLTDSDVSVEFYFTSSLISSLKSTNQLGLLKLGSISAYKPIEETVYDQTSFLFSLSEDLYGTLVIVPKKCSAVLSNISLKPYGDFGFSTDTLITRIPFPVNIANESFEIKSELFDINSKLVYSDLRTITTFDPSGSSLAVFIPGLKDPSKTSFLSGSLEVSKSLWVGENAYITGSLQIGGTVKLDGIVESSYTNERMLSWNPSNHKVYYTNVNDIDYLGSSIGIKLYNKNGTDLSTYRVIPCIEGKNISVLKSKNTQGGGVSLG
jgi:hypothetical protein